MQQPQKKRSPREMAARAYDYFRRAEREGRVLTIEAICRYTGYKPGTLRSHISKKYSKSFLHGDNTTGYTVSGLIETMTKAEFVKMHRQIVDRVVPPAPTSPLFVKKEVEYYYRLESNSAEMWLIIIGLIVAGIWWRKS